MILGRPRLALLYSAYRPPRLASDFLLDDDCCEKHPEEPTVSLDVEWLANFKVKVTIHASHPCGIKHVTVFIAEKHVKLMQPGDIEVESYDGKMVNGHHIDDSAEINEAGPIVKSFTLPVGELGDDAFYIAGTATSACKTTGGDHKGGYVIV
jgi:hypothetical protein